MSEYDEATYGERVADVYDDWFGERLGPVDRTVETLADLARGGSALELGIGTGRVALPLAAAGIDVHGIDASEAMVARLRDKPGGDSIPVTMGDFGEFDLGRTFDLIYVVFNTFFGLLTQDEQVAAFHVVRRHLPDDGAFVIEAFVPDLNRFRYGQSTSAIDVGVDEVRLDVSKIDRATQRVDAQHVQLRSGEVVLRPVRIRFAYPSELDLMARLAGMRLRERWADWDRSAFTSEAPKHVSVWEPAS